MAPPGKAKSKRIAEKNLKKNRVTRPKEPRTRPRSSQAPPPPSQGPSVTFQPMPGFGTASFVPPPPYLPSHPPPFGTKTFPLHYQYGVDSRMSGFAAPYSYQPPLNAPTPTSNNDALVAAVTQAVVAAIPAIMSSVETRLVAAVKNAIQLPLADAALEPTASDPKCNNTGATDALRKTLLTVKSVSNLEMQRWKPFHVWEPVRELPSHWNRLYCEGFTDKQINGYMKKNGFVEVAGGAGLLFRRTLVIKSGIITMWSGHLGSVSIPNPMTRSQWDQVYLFWQQGYNCLFIITRDFVHPLWMANKRFKGPYAKKLRASLPEAAYTEQDSHVGLIWAKGFHWKFVDINNFDDVQGDFVERFRSEVRSKALPHILRWMNLKMGTIKIADCCAVYCLFAIEQIANDHPNLELNTSLALSLLFFKKVTFHIGGDRPFSEFKKSNPNWEKETFIFPLEPILYGLKDGGDISPDLLRKLLLWMSPDGLREKDDNDDLFYPIRSMKRKRVNL